MKNYFTTLDVERLFSLELYLLYIWPVTHVISFHILDWCCVTHSNHNDTQMFLGPRISKPFIIISFILTGLNLTAPQSWSCRVSIRIILTGNYVKHQHKTNFFIWVGKNGITKFWQLWSWLKVLKCQVLTRSLFTPAAQTNRNTLIKWSLRDLHFPLFIIIMHHCAPVCTPTCLFSWCTRVIVTCLNAVVAE